MSALLWWLGGCGGGPGPGDTGVEGPLLDWEGWAPVDAADDPFADHRPDPIDCPASAITLEGAALEVDTGACDWAALTRPLKGPLVAGEPLEWIFWHAWLTAEAPAEAHLALAIDGVVAGEWFVPIPADPTAWTEAFEAPADAPAGAPVVLHLHNHGANTWNLLPPERAAP